MLTSYGRSANLESAAPQNEGTVFQTFRKYSGRCVVCAGRDRSCRRDVFSIADPRLATPLSARNAKSADTRLGILYLEDATIQETL